MNAKDMTIWDNRQVLVEDKTTRKNRWYENVTNSSRARLFNLFNSEQYPVSVIMSEWTNLAIYIHREASK